MNKLIKIRDVTAKYDVSACTLRYYEDMGLLQSIRSEDYAYRLYDEAAVKRLEQILILRRLKSAFRISDAYFVPPAPKLFWMCWAKRSVISMKRYPSCMNSKRSFWILSGRLRKRISERTPM